MLLRQEKKGGPPGKIIDDDSSRLLTTERFPTTTCDSNYDNSIRISRIWKMQDSDCRSLEFIINCIKFLKTTSSWARTTTKRFSTSSLIILYYYFVSFDGSCPYRKSLREVYRE